MLYMCICYMYMLYIYVYMLYICVYVMYECFTSCRFCSYILHYLGSLLSYCTLIFDLMRSYIYNACILTFSGVSFLALYIYLRGNGYCLYPEITIL